MTRTCPRGEVTWGYAAAEALDLSGNSSKF